MTKNEAAERLLALVTSGATPGYYGIVADGLDAALAEERRHVIEQIRERLDSTRWMPGDVAAILDDLSIPTGAEKP